MVARWVYTTSMMQIEYSRRQIHIVLPISRRARIRSTLGIVGKKLGIYNLLAQSVSFKYDAHKKLCGGSTIQWARSLKDVAIFSTGKSPRGFQLPVI